MRKGPADRSTADTVASSLSSSLGVRDLPGGGW